KTDDRVALHILDLLVREKFPRIWIPSPENRDLRQMLRHRDKLVRIRTSVQNQLHALAMSQGLCRKAKLWTKAGRKELEGLPLDPWASRRRLASGRTREGEHPELTPSIFCSPGSPNKRRECTGKCRQFNGFGLVQAGSGPGGRWFKSIRPDQSFQALTRDFWFFVYSAVDDFVDGSLPLEPPECVDLPILSRTVGT